MRILSYVYRTKKSFVLINLHILMMPMKTMMTPKRAAPLLMQSSVAVTARFTGGFKFSDGDKGRAR